MSFIGEDDSMSDGLPFFLERDSLGTAKLFLEGIFFIEGVGLISDYLL